MITNEAMSTLLLKTKPSGASNNDEYAILLNGMAVF